MRSILFKAKKLSDGKWVKGSLVKTPFGTFIEWYEDSICNKREVDPSTVCQFTGLKDCEGREVWEGDILQDVDDDDIKYVIIFDVGAFLAQKEGLYTSIPLHECVGSLCNDVITYAKVIGNKFDKEGVAYEG